MFNTLTTTTGFTNKDVSSFSSAQTMIKHADSALNSVNTARATLGAYQSRFESIASNLERSAENLSASRSRILDADFAAETAAMTKAQILQQAGISVCRRRMLRLRTFWLCSSKLAKSQRRQPGSHFWLSGFFSSELKGGGSCE